MELTNKTKHTAGEVLAAVVIGALVLITISSMGVPLWRMGQARMAQQTLDEAVSQTAAGKFAVENFTACKHAGGLLSAPQSDALCITETVDGAEKLYGHAFAVQVTEELRTWVAQSSKLQPR